MYEGTECKLLMTRLDEITVPITGRVVSCRHVEGTLHEIGIKFDRRIDPRSYFRGADGEGGSADSVELPDMGGHLLYLDDSPMDLKLLAHHLKPTSIDLKTSGTIAEAMQMMKDHSFDFIFCDLNLDGDWETAESLLVASVDYTESTFGKDFTRSRKSQ